jgi:hypothetical protein
VVNGTSTVTLQNQLVADDNNRFEGGTLYDIVGNSFTIVSNTQNTVLVNNLPGGTIPAQGDAALRDDDSLQDTNDVPMPDTSELDAAMNQAYVTVLFDVGDDNSHVPFVLNSSSNANDPEFFVNSFDWDSKNANAIPYWVTYILGGFQEAAGDDNDPVTEGWVMGRTSLPQGGSISYLEVIRDVSLENGWDPVRKEQDNVVHEVGHAVGNSAVEPVTRFYDPISVYSRYTEAYLRSIRESDKPAD